MALNIKASSHVHSQVRERGRQYFRSGAVHIQRGDAWSVLAAVDGSNRYEVCLSRQNSHLKVWCTCPYFDDRLQVCKHIWATILAAQAKGYLGGTETGNTLKLEEDLEGLEARRGDDQGRTTEWNGYDQNNEFDGDDEDLDDETDNDARSRSYRPPIARRSPLPKRPSWRQVLGEMRAADETPAADSASSTAAREIHYLVDVAATLTGKGLVLVTGWRSKKKDGNWGKLKFQRIEREHIDRLTEPADREIVTLLLGAENQESWRQAYYGYRQSSTRCIVPPAMQAVLLPMLCRTGRFRLRKSNEDGEGEPLQWDDAEPWDLWLRVAVAEGKQKFELRGELRRGDDRVDATKPELLVRGAFVFWHDRVARLCDHGAFDWLPVLRQQGTITVPSKDKDKLLSELFSLPALPRLDLPEELRCEEVTLPPRPCLKVMAPKQTWGAPPRLLGKLSFDYGGTIIPAERPGQGVFQAEPRRLIRRDAVIENAAACLALQLGFKHGYEDLELAPRHLPQVVRQLVDAGWHVEAEGKIYRSSGSIRIEVKSGVDWFDMHGHARFDGIDVSFPQLLKALQRGENTIRLDDGTFGMLPEEWLKKYGLFARLGKVEGQSLRFRRTQVGVLDALLETQPEVRVDAQFVKARDELRRFTGVEAVDPPAGFVGQLRGYQREALGWLDFLQRFGFGGCLADDMGLGKTVMVLALLESRRQLRARRRRSGRAVPPTLAVVPRSLVFNWKQEAARFAPQLRVLDHTGIARSESAEAFDQCDLVLTTYGTLRRDITWFKDIQFDYCILDEAQAIKNSATESAKSARLLQAQHRLVLSGTPVENHLGELWSLFEFLNPGMLGHHAASSLDGGLRNPSAETRTWLARALRPYILRRTKEQVARDLPAKTEQTIYCDLEPSQRQLYDELRAFYRQSLLPRIEREGMKRTRIQVLEALLRLRQAACHPGLVDKTRTGEASAKLDILRAQLAEVVDEGHKALVFSQFTSLLAIVRQQLDKEGIPHVYLDGRTRDRQAKVEQFQNDPASKLFLISLKAGGLGLNLTAAEYVFLLDPWWNPAVEMQAIDRAHRIGQTRPVFAFRLIARDTVEEKVLELQKAKRDLADAIINADNSLIRNLSREDLEMLLS